MIDHESSLHLKAVKIKLSFPQQIVEEHEHVRDTTHPPKHYGCIYVTRSLYKVTFPMSYRNVGSSCPHYRERRRSPHRTDSDALYAVGGGNTGPASSVTTDFTPYYLDKKHRREDTPVLHARDAKRWGHCGEHAVTMVDPEVSPEQTCMLGRFPVCLGPVRPTKDTYRSWRDYFPTSRRLSP